MNYELLSATNIYEMGSFAILLLEYQFYATSERVAQIRQNYKWLWIMNSLIHSVYPILNFESDFVSLEVGISVAALKFWLSATNIHEMGSFAILLLEYQFYATSERVA